MVALLVALWWLLVADVGGSVGGCWWLYWWLLSVAVSGSIGGCWWLYWWLMN